MSKIWHKVPWIIALIICIAGLIWPKAFPWMIVVAMAVACYFRPRRGLIGPVELPADDAYLPDEQVQWWYWTGHLQTDDGRRFGFEVVFFAFDNFSILRDQLVQAAITDVSEDSFAFEEYIRFYPPKGIKNSFNLSSGSDNKITAVGGDGKDRLHSEVGKYVLDIDLISTKPVAMHYGGDAHPYRFGGFTYYYSRPCMETSGTLTIDGKSHKVSGTSWFDRQYGELEPAMFKGWQWFAIELDDNRQYMLFDFLGKGKDAAVEKSGSVTNAQGQTRTLTAQDFDVKILGHWKSPHSDANYPSGWAVTVEGQTFTVQPLVKDQELHGKRGEMWVGVYWEGACSVSGAANGKAYVELNGYTSPIEL
ncbi:MAG: lipocalin family protein [Gallionella sp.]|nr:lipocalin family protein [Gallionella sp.]